MTTTALPTAHRNGAPLSLDSSFRTEAGLARRNAGMTWQQIADEVGYSTPRMAEAAVMRFVAYLNGNAAPTTGRQSIARSAVVTFTRSFGIELEFKGLTLRAAAAALESTLGYLPAVTGYHQSGTPDFTRWHVERDGSVTDSRGRGGEVVSPILRGSEGIEEMRRVMRALADAGARVSRACGMHVHIDARDLTGEQIARLIGAYADRQAAFDQFVSPSRRNGQNGYCQPMPSYEKDRLVADFTSATATGIGAVARTGRRYRTVNVTSFGRTGTIEFRQHQGSMNGSKAKGWVETLLSLVNAVLATQDETLPTTATELIEALRPFGITGAAARNMLSRIS